MQLYPHQQEAIERLRDALRRNQSVLLRAATGFGKTALASFMLSGCVSSSKRALFMCHRKELVEQTSKTLARVNLAHGFIASGRRYDPYVGCHIASVDTLKNRLESLQPVDLIIIDECFPGFQTVDGIRIDKIKKGDFVSSYNHETLSVEAREVLSVFTRSYNGSWYRILSAGKEIICTEGHPIYTKEYGYIPAMQLHMVGKHVSVAHGKDLPALPEKFSSEKKAPETPFQILWEHLFGGSKKKRVRKERAPRDFLLGVWKKLLASDTEVTPCHGENRESVLLGWVQRCLYERTFFYSHEADKPKAPSYYIGAHEKEQSYVFTRKYREDAPKHGGENVSFERGKWSIHIPAKEVIRYSWRWFLHGTPNISKGCQGEIPVSPEVLQGGYSSPRNDASNRGGWEKSSAKKMDIFGQKENRNIEFFGVDGIEVYKRGSGRKPKWVPKKNKVYNLHIAENENYFVNNILVHNCHHASARGWAMVHEWAKAAGSKIVGLTATPWRLDGRGLDMFFDEMVDTPSVSWLMENGFLSRYEAYAPSVPDMSGVGSRMGDFKAEDVERVMDSPALFGDAVDNWRKHAEGRRTVGFASSVNMSMRLAEKFCAAGIPASHLDGAMDKAMRRRIIDQFASGQLSVIFNVNLFSEGFDLSAIAGRDVPIEAAILYRPTQSLTLHLQQVGRALRPQSRPAVILDHAGNLLRLGLPDSDFEWSLKGREKKRGKKKQDSDDDLHVRQCPACFLVHKTPAASCPHCGHVYPPPKERKQEVVEGTLQRISKEEIEENKRNRRDILRGCKEYGDFLAAARMLGYKPGWAWYQHQEYRKRVGKRDNETGATAPV